MKRHFKESRAAQDRLLKQVHALTELKRGVTWEEGASADGGGSRLGSLVDGGATHRGSSVKQQAPVLRRAPLDVRIHEVEQQSNRQHHVESDYILRLQHRSVMEQAAALAAGMQRRPALDRLRARLSSLGEDGTLTLTMTLTLTLTLILTLTLTPTLL